MHTCIRSKPGQRPCASVSTPLPGVPVPHLHPDGEGRGPAPLVQPGAPGTVRAVLAAPCSGCVRQASGGEWTYCETRGCSMRALRVEEQGQDIEPTWLVAPLQATMHDSAHRSRVMCIRLRLHDSGNRSRLPTPDSP